jgi:putative effector of murein hydrolase
MAAETGLPSLFIFITIIYLIYKRVKKRYKESEYNKPIYLGLLGALFILLIQWLSFYAYMTTLAWFIIGLLLAVPKVKEGHVSAY